MYINELVRIVTSEVLKRMNKRILLFISGKAANLKEIFEVLNEYKSVNYSAVLSNSARDVISEVYIRNLNFEVLGEEDCIVKAINDADLILIPVLTRNTLAKAALGIRDNQITIGISEAIMRNKRIIAVKDSCDPYGEVLKSMGVAQNREYNKMLDSYLRTLESFGIRLINFCELRNVMDVEIENQVNLVKEVGAGEKISDKVLSGVITMGDILKADKNEEILIAKGAIITPLARDYIIDEKIKIKYC